MIGTTAGDPSTAHLGFGMPAGGLFAGKTFPTHPALRLSSKLQSVPPWKPVFLKRLWSDKKGRT